MNFLQQITWFNRITVVALIGGLVATFYFPIPEGVGEQQLGWLQGILGTLIMVIVNGAERQSDFWFKDIKED